MASIDNIISGYPNFKGYSGDAPKNKEEYLALINDQDVFEGNAPTWEEISPRISEEDVRKERSKQYPAIGEQLDMLWHAINDNTELQTTFSDFYNVIKAVKDANPK